MYYSKMLYSLFLLVIKTSTESLWSRKEKQRLFDGRLSVACLSCGKLVLIPSKHRDIQHIHSAQHILGGVHSIHHREEQGQLRAWPQHHAFHNIHMYRDIHSVQHILGGVHSILHREEQGQLQAWPQHHAFHSVQHIRDDVHNILRKEEQDQLQPWPQVQPHVCHNIRKYRDIHNVLHILDGVHNILRKEEQDRPWLQAQPLPHACQYSVHMYKDIHIHILDGVHNILHKEEPDQPQPWALPLHRQQLPDRQWQST